MPLLIKDGEIVTADARYRADLFCEGETITRIGNNLTAPPGTEVIDASGASVVLVRTSAASDGIFGSTAYSSRSTVRVTREASGWRITVPPDPYLLRTTEP